MTFLSFHEKLLRIVAFEPADFKIGLLSFFRPFLQGFYLTSSRGPSGNERFQYRQARRRCERHGIAFSPNDIGYFYQCSISERISCNREARYPPY